MVSTFEKATIKKATAEQITTEQIVGDRYRIMHPLGAGGMSQTYFAEDTQRPNNPACVVKKLKSSTDDKDQLKDTRKLFEREAETLEKLGNHDQIPRLLAYFEEDGNFYLVQEFVEGHPLTREMPLGEWWTESQTLQFIKDLLEILAIVHSHNVIHLDIKPANIIRRKHDQKLVLIDFGAVKRVHLQPKPRNELGKTQSTVLTCVGTRGYMATEQLTGKPNLSSDIYALGMTAIQAVTGILPIQLRETDEGEVAWRDQAEVSDELAEVLSKMVRRYHKQRYQSVADVLQALESVEMSAVIRSALPLKIDSAVALSPETFGFSQLHRPLSGISNIPTINAPISSEDTIEVEEIGEEEISDAVVDVPKVVLSAQKLPKQPHFIQSIGQCFSKENWLRSSLVMLSASVVVGSGLLGHHQWQRHNQKTLLAELEALAHTGKAEACISQALTFPKTLPDLHQRSINTLENCSQQVLEEAKTSAKGSSFVAAAELTKTIPSEAKITYARAQELAKDWHSEIVGRAENLYRQCQANDAIAALRAIPEDSHLYKEAQAKATSWHAEWITNGTLMRAAQEIVENDRALRDAESFRQKNRIDSARGNLSHANEQSSAAQAKLNSLTMLGESIDNNDSCVPSNVKGLSDIRETIINRNITAEALKRNIDHTEKVPLSLIGQLAKKKGNKNVLKESFGRTNVLFEDHEIWGDAGERWSISMKSSDFDPVVHLVYPKNSDQSARSYVVSNNNGGNGNNSYLRSVTLPESGLYRVRASAYNSPSGGEGTGSYELVVTKLSDD